jgi:small subunit ribosomal protein S11
MAEEKDNKTTQKETEKKVSKKKETASKVETTKKVEATEKSKTPSKDEVVDKKEVKKEVKKEKTQEESVEIAAAPVMKKKKNLRRQIQRGRAYIRSSYNNTVVSLTDLHGNLLAWSSSGLLGFKGAKKATTYAATQVAADVDEKVQKYGLRDIEVYIKGVGSGREAALRALAQKGYGITKIKDMTPIPHNGCRSKKPRRV